MKTARKTKAPSPKTVGRGKVTMPTAVSESTSFPREFYLPNGTAVLYLGDFLDVHDAWPSPITIVSDGAYGVLGFDGDTAHEGALAEWYLPHIKAWSRKSTPQTTLWLWNTEIGWATLHPILIKHGWKYVGINIWNKGLSHIAGKNTGNLRRFPVVTEVCAQYVRDVKINGLPIKAWLLAEWKRTGLPLYKANEAAGVKSAATRKYFDQGHLWYPPPPDAFIRLVQYANEHGDPRGAPYYSLDGINPLSKEGWGRLFPKFNPQYGYTNVWNRPALKGKERLTVGRGGRSMHLNQKPLDLMRLIIEASSDPGDVVWEPFGGLFTASLAASLSGRVGYGSEIDPDYFAVGVHRIKTGAQNSPLLQQAPLIPEIYTEGRSDQGDNA